MMRLSACLPVRLGARRGFPAIRLERLSNIRARPDPLGPPAGNKIVAKLGSVVGTPV